MRDPNASRVPNPQFRPELLPDLSEFATLQKKFHHILSVDYISFTPLKNDLKLIKISTYCKSADSLKIPIKTTLKVGTKNKNHNENETGVILIIQPNVNHS